LAQAFQAHLSPRTCARRRAERSSPKADTSSALTSSFALTMVVTCGLPVRHRVTRAGLELPPRGEERSSATIVKPAALQRGASCATVMHVEVEGLMEWDVYADEAGGLPLRDSDDVFVAAAFAVPRSVRLELLPSGRVGAKRTVELLRQIGGHPQCMYVRPFPGYSASLHRRLDWMSGMGLTIRRRSGVNASFVGPEGIRDTSYVWTAPMTAAVQLAMNAAIFATGAYPARVRVFFDAKSLPTEAATMVKTQTGHIGHHLQTSLGRTLEKFPADERTQKLVASSAALAPVTIEWEDEPGFSGAAPGLHLADSLSSRICRAIRRRRRQRGMREALETAGYKGAILNYTSQIIRPPDPSTIADWERRTGLVLPSFPPPAREPALGR
jgi:hypothetical protein